MRGLSDAYVVRVFPAVRARRLVARPLFFDTAGEPASLFANHGNLI